jgi:hypothetical protein
VTDNNTGEFKMILDIALYIRQWELYNDLDQTDDIPSNEKEAFEFIKETIINVAYNKFDWTGLTDFDVESIMDEMTDWTSEDDLTWAINTVWKREHCIVEPEPFDSEDWLRN